MTKTRRIDKAERVRVANEICVLYYEAVRTEVAALTNGGRVNHVPKDATLDALDASDRKCFIQAAKICVEEGADAREYVVAQFARWREASAYHKKFLLPSPHHLGKEGARVRYLMHKVTTEIRRSRVVTIDEQPGRQRFYVEERQLKGIARVQRVDPADVIADQPERFSREFLEHKGAWGAVKDLWEERRA
jgi:hypothetical protein